MKPMRLLSNNAIIRLKMLEGVKKCNLVHFFTTLFTTNIFKRKVKVSCKKVKKGVVTPSPYNVLVASFNTADLVPGTIP